MSSHRQPSTPPISQPAIVNAAEWNNAKRITRHNSPTNVHFDPSMSSAQQLEILRALGLVQGNGTPYQGTVVFNGAEFNNSATTIERFDSETNLSFGARTPSSSPFVSPANSQLQGQEHGDPENPGNSYPHSNNRTAAHNTVTQGQEQVYNAPPSTARSISENLNMPPSRRAGSSSQQRTSINHGAPEGMSWSRTY
ncbi:hypothetical protein MVEN_00225600 [Mycena venus]|uniref:Uncharacterized protein n=1 Tax=Mycena venus TaxID=2733690 RepID=A0A8H6Z477_9AGAR|nr:hypothetical protein MVEN_00225600 [Mycena venus]